MLDHSFAPLIPNSIPYQQFEEKTGGGDEGSCHPGCARLYHEGVWDMDGAQNDETQTHVALTQGTLVSHYRIIDKIGAGGMGEVYLAEDIKLDRRVALKFLPTNMMQNPDVRARFIREAQAVAKLDHPNIITIYEVSEFNNRPFFAMQYVDGKTLYHYFSEATLSIPEIVELVSQLSAGLGSAHEVGITHRDIKSTNIIVDKSFSPKILDFGLATVQGTEILTKTGSTLGTIAYMSPEQAKGLKVDHRSDIFSLGVVLYELVTGHAPFRRDSEAATLSAIVTDTPEPLARYRANVPDELQRIVSKLLSKDPSLRYQTAKDLRADLMQLSLSSQPTAPVVAIQEESIIVLPFENLSTDADNEYFSDGLTEEIITDLGKIREVTVISRKSSMQLKGTDKDIRTVGREYGVRYVLTGSVRRMRESIRVNVELVEATNERQVWAERFSGTLKDVFDIQEEIARAIAGALQVKLSVTEDMALAQRSIVNPRAYDLYLQSRQETNRWVLEGLDAARRLLTEALELEPDSAALNAALGYSYYNYVNLGFHQEESIEMANKYAQKAFELDSQSVDALRLKGVIAVSLAGGGPGGVKLLEEVLRLAPQDTEAMWWLSIAYCFIGRGLHAIATAERLIQIEPFILQNHSALAWAHFKNGNFDRAIGIVDGAYARDPHNALLQFTRVQIQLYSGRENDAAEYIQVAESRTELTIFDRLVLAQIYAIQGDRHNAELVMTEEFERSARRDLQYSWQIAVVRTLLGDYEEALDWLELAIQNGYGNYRFLTEFDPHLKPLRDHERFKSLIERIRNQESPS